MARPEGYRKAVRLMELADRFGLPVIALVDTAGAFPGVDAEERGQAEAIARSTDACLALGVPNVAVIIGEGGSGGAIAIATANKVLMLEHAIYTVASPEAAASILWRDSSQGAGRGDRHEDHRPGPAEVRRHRRRSSPSRSAARTAIRKPRSPRPAGRSARRCEALAEPQRRPDPRGAGREVPRHGPQGLKSAGFGPARRYSASFAGMIA